MSYLTARVLVDTPYRSWIDRVVETWEGYGAHARWSWRGELRPRGVLRFEERRIPQTEWPQLASDLRAGRYGDVWLTGAEGGQEHAVMGVPVVASVGLQTEHQVLFERIYPDLPSFVESERHVRCITLSTDRHDAAALERFVVEVFQCADGCWAQLGFEPRAAQPFRPATRGWREWEPYARGHAVDAASLVILGPGQISALGGLDEARRILAEHQVRPIETASGATGLVVAAAPTPIGANDPRVNALRRSLAPILLEAPITYAPAFLLDTRATGPIPNEISGTQHRRLGSETLCISTGPAFRRDDVEGGTRLAAALECIYAQIPTSLLRQGTSLCIPRFLGDINYQRLFPSMPVIDTGEPFTDTVPLTIFATGHRAKQLLAAFTEVIAQRVAGASCRPGAEELVCEIPLVAAEPEPLLDLLIALDHAVAAIRGARPLGVVLGRIPPTDEMVERTAAGQWPGFGPRPR
jgi:hypothetical protein